MSMPNLGQIDLTGTEKMALTYFRVWVGVNKCPYQISAPLYKQPATLTMFLRDCARDPNSKISVCFCGKRD